MSLEEKRNLNGNIPLEDHIHIIMETVRKIKQSDTNKIAKIESCLDMMVDLAVIILDYRGYQYLQSEKKSCIRIALLSILEIWLCNDESITKTIYRRAQDNGDVDKVLEQGFRRAEAILRDNIALQNEQAKMEGIAYKRMPYKKNSKTLYDLVDLAFMEKYADGINGIYDQIYYNKDSMNKDNGTVLEKWCEAYDNLNKLSKKILDIKNNYKELFYSKKNSSINTDEALSYISTFLFFIKFEKTHRPIYVARLAKYIQENGYSVDDINMDVLQISLNRYKTNQIVLTNSSALFFGYDENFSMLFKKNAELVNCYNEIVLMRRKLIDDILLLFNKYVGFSFLDKCKEDDIRYAVQYITNLTSVDELFEPVVVKATDAQHIKNIQSIYNSDIFKQECMQQTRKKLRKKRKLRNIKYNQPPKGKYNKHNP